MVRLVTVIGHGVELLPHFIQHYEKYVDEIQIVVYESDENPFLIDKINDYIKNYDFINVVKLFYFRQFDWEKVTELYNQTKLTHPNDWWVVADIDEFHLYPNNSVKSLIEYCDGQEFDMARGGFIDRIGENGEFPKLNIRQSIWKQFPYAGFFRYPMSNACPNKVCVMKGYVELTSGQHYAKINGETTWRWQGWNHPLIAPIFPFSVQVHHFKWDKTSIERIKKIADLDKDYAFSSEYKIMYDSLKQNNFKIDINNFEFMFERNQTEPDYTNYKKWNKLIKKIISI